MYAVVESGGKQYRVEEGATVQVERLDAEPGAALTLDRVLLVAEDDAVKIGAPVVEGATVTAKVVGHGRGRKVVVFKYKAKAHYRRKRGHRQSYTSLLIEKISV